MPPTPQRRSTESSSVQGVDAAILLAVRGREDAGRLSTCVTTLTHLVRWPRCSIAWDFGCAKWSKPNRKRRLLRPTPLSTILKQRPTSGGIIEGQMVEH